MNAGRVQVIVRIRPFSRAELMDGGGVGVQSQGSSVFLQNNTSYVFDSVLDPDSSQEDVSAAVLGTLLDKFFQGFNCTVFAYGQTGAGKTYTIGVPNQSSLDYVDSCFQTTSEATANCSDAGASAPELNSKFSHIGLIPRFLVQLFTRLIDIQSIWKVRISFLEVYNETLRDLLSPDTDPSSLSIRDHNGKIIVKNLTEREVTTATEAAQCFVSGGLIRITAATNMNEQSSRSHSIFTVTLERIETNNKFISKFSFIDLAGSERAKKSGATGLQFKEMIGINSGLLALGNVISALTTNQNSAGKRHIPYRDSKLTRLLQDSLGGTSETMMIANISPFIGNFDESNSTILYAARARSVVNTPAACREELNLGQAQDQVRKLIKSLEEENIAAKEDLARVRQQRDDLRGELTILEAQLSECNKQLILMAKTSLPESPTENAKREEEPAEAQGTSETVKEIIRSHCISLEQDLRARYAPTKIQTINLLFNVLTEYICKTYAVDGSNYDQILENLFNKEILDLPKRNSKEFQANKQLKATPSKKRLSSGKHLLTVENGKLISHDLTITAILNALLILRKPISNVKQNKKQSQKGQRAATKEEKSRLSKDIGESFETRISQIGDSLLELPVRRSLSALSTSTASLSMSLKYSMLEKTSSSDTSLVNINEFLDKSSLMPAGDNNTEEKQDVYDLAYNDLVNNVKNVPEGSQALAAIKDLIKRLICKEALPEEIYHSTVTAMMALQKQQEHILELEGQMAYIQQKVQGKSNEDNVIELRDRIRTLEEEHRAALEELRTKEQVQLAMDQVQKRFQSTIAKYKKEILEKTRAYEEASRLLKSQSATFLLGASPTAAGPNENNRYSYKKLHRRTCSTVESSISNSDLSAKRPSQTSSSHITNYNKADYRNNKIVAQHAPHGHRHTNAQSNKLSEIDKKLEDLQSMYAYNAKNEERLKHQVESLEAEKARLEKRIAQLEHDLRLKVLSPIKAAPDGAVRVRQQAPQQHLRGRQQIGSCNNSQISRGKDKEHEEIKELQLQGMPMNNIAIRRT